MTTFILIPGAGGDAWHWHRVVPLLKQAGHDAIAVDLPGDDDQAGLSVYTDCVVEAIGARQVNLVAQSLGGFTAPLVCARVRVAMLVLVNAMIPIPGETVGEWWDNTGSAAARKAAAQQGGYDTNFNLETYFFHDVPPEIVKRGEEHQRPQADSISAEPCRFESWPEIPIRVIAGRDDRFFPIDFQRRIARERLHATTDELRGGHLLALSNPHDLANLLLRYLPGTSR